MPDRYGDNDDKPVVDFDSRRQAREAAAAAEAARQQRARLSESRAVHAPLDRGQSDMARQHRTAVTSQAEAVRNAMRIVNCPLCDENGYRGALVCDHIDRTKTRQRGMAAIRKAMGWPTPPETPEKPGEAK